jgi:polyhydroxybutyrate depolymerase
VAVAEGDCGGESGRLYWAVISVSGDRAVGCDSVRLKGMQMRSSRRFLVSLTIGCLWLGACTSTTNSNDAGPATINPVGPATQPSGTSGTPTAASPGARAAGPAKPSPGCATSADGALDKERRTVEVGAGERFYFLSTPGDHDGKTPSPLVIDFHGLLEGAQIHTAMTNYARLAQSDGFVVAVPNGSGVPLRWDVKPGPENQDLAFVDAMLDQLGNDLCIDTSRVYATGFSYGAIMTSFLTCQRSDRFAAVAPVAGLMVPTPCDQARRVPILTFHGTADPVLLFNGGSGRIPGITPAEESVPPPPPADINGSGYPANAAQWAGRNGCAPTPVDTNVTEKVIHRVYDCPADAAVEFYIILDGGHAWPASAFSKMIEPFVGPTTFDIDATKLSWEFFQRFRLP